MKILLQLAAITLLAQFSQMWCPVSAQIAAKPLEGFQISLPPGVKSEDVQIQYFLVTGPFGGYSSLIGTKLGAREYVIPTNAEGKAADTLKAIVFVPGCRIKTISVATLENSTRRADFLCAPLPSSIFSGRIEEPQSLQGRDYAIEVDLLATWVMGFFGIGDGAAPVLHIATVTPSDDGSFRVQLPDLTKDAASNSFGADGSMFRFIAREKRTENILAWLQPAHAKSDLFRGSDLRPQTIYPDEIAFGLRVNR